MPVHYFMKQALYWLVIYLLLVSVMISPARAQIAPVHHIVLVWFPPGTATAQIETVIQQSRALTAIEGVSNLKVGKAIASDRSIVDDSFDIGISMQFESVEAMNRYLAHPQHQAFVQQYIKGKASRLLVYDF